MISTPQKTGSRQILELPGTVIRADNGFVIVNQPLDESLDCPASQTSTSMGKKGKKKKKWPGLNYEIDVPKLHVGTFSFSDMRVFIRLINLQRQFHRNINDNQLLN